jgi:microcystin-dependent protein
MSGVESITLLISEIPLHTHGLMAAGSDPAESNTCTNNALARSKNGNAYTSTLTITQMAPQGLPPAGGGLPHNNMQPYLTLNFCIALQGIFPQRP